MVYPRPRSMNHDLEEGMSDGKYKKIVANRGGIVEKDLFYTSRHDLNDLWYGIHEDMVKILPDGTVDQRSLNYVENAPAEVGGVHHAQSA